MAEREEMFSMLRKKLSAYDAFLFATNLIQKALENEEMDTVDRLIKRREELITCIEELDRQIVGSMTVATHWHHQISSVPMSFVNDLSDRLKQIMTIDKKCQAIAVRHRDLARKDLMTIHRNKAGVRSYGPKNEMVPKFIEIQT